MLKNESEPIYTIDTLLYVTRESAKSGYLSEIKPCLNDQDGVMHVSWNLVALKVVFFFLKLNVRIVRLFLYKQVS